MKKVFFFFLAFTALQFFCIAFVSAQNTLGIEWQNSWGGVNNEWGQKIMKDADGSYYVIGQINSSGGDVPVINGYNDVLLVKFSKSGQKIWAKSYGHQFHSAEGMAFARTGDGGFIIAGTIIGGYCKKAFNGQSISDILVIKTDANGVQQWEQCFGGPENEFGLGILVNSDGTYMLMGETGSNEYDISGNHGKSDIWLAKLSATGAVIWSRCIGGTNIETGYDMLRTADGGFIIAGRTYSNDGDISGNHGNIDGLVIKFDAAGTIQWQKCYGTDRSEFFNKIVQDASGNYFLTGTGSNPAVNYSGGEDAWVVKLDGTGNLLWQEFLGGWNWWDNGNSLVLTKDNTIGICGRIASSTDDFAANRYEHRFWVARLNRNDGKILQQAFFGSKYGDDSPFDIVEAEDGGLVAVGITTGTNPYVQNHKGGTYDIWLIKLGAFNTVKGSVYLDKNQNGIKDGGEPPFPEGKIILKKGQDSVVIASDHGNFIHNIDTGNYAISFVPDWPYYTVDPSPRQIYFGGYYNTDSFDFRVTPLPGKMDLAITGWSVSRVRMNFDATIYLKYKNKGTSDVNATIKFAKDSRTNFVSTPAGAVIDGDTVSINVGILTPDAGGQISIVLKAGIPPELNFNDVLKHFAEITLPAQDLYPSDNAQAIHQSVMGSYDPNDKQEVSMGDSISLKQVSDGEYLQYLIRFQNTGNDTAFKIVIRDTLDQKLDWGSFEMISASHSYKLEITAKNKLAWTFDPVKLPDSNVNEPASHGYILYRIKPLPAAGVGTIIANSASIYFDFNLPVKTNTTLTKVVTSPLEAPVLTALQSNYCGNQGMQKVKITNHPASGSGVTVSVKIDGNTVAVGADSSFSFNVSTLAVGQHSVQVQFSNATTNKVSSSDFTITEAVNPNVDVSSNVTNITSLATQVIVTATNAAGGGTAPLYTFAKDRNFTSIAQPESANNTWTFSPSILTIGDNKIYVRMKTSSSCFVVNTNIDSILLVRSSVTGITDPDMPGQAINIYPNPFKDAITINGLSSSKTYTIRLFSLEGKQLVSKRISGRTSMTIPGQHQAKGVYWLSIYDEKRNRLIGTVKMMKD